MCCKKYWDFSFIFCSCIHISLVKFWKFYISCFNWNLKYTTEDLLFVCLNQIILTESLKCWKPKPNVCAWNTFSILRKHTHVQICFGDRRLRVRRVVWDDVHMWKCSLLMGLCTVNILLVNAYRSSFRFLHNRQPWYIQAILPLMKVQVY